MSPVKFIIALDQGTTSSRAILFDCQGTALFTSQREFRQIFPKPGWVEHDPNEIWQSQLDAVRDVIDRSPGEVAAIGIANQRETIVAWDRSTGEAVHNAIVWQDRRTTDFCETLIARGLTELVQNKTGLVIDAYFSASKIRWLLDNVRGLRDRASRGEIAIGTIDSWLLYKLTGGRVFATDVTNASRTMLFDIHAMQWDEELLELFSVPRDTLPEVRASSDYFGETSRNLFGRGIPITGIAGDQQAALFGQRCFTPGAAKNTYGTGCFLLMNSGIAAPVSRNKLLSTVAWKLKGQTQYALEGSVFIGGAVVQWLRDGLGIIKSAAEVEALAASVPDSGDVYLVPAFAGLGAPHWDQRARGSIAGLTRGTTAAHLARAAIEAIAFQVADVLDVMMVDSGAQLRELRVDGGASANALLMQFQADLLGVSVVRPSVTETTALGAALLAGLGSGLFKSQSELAELSFPETRFAPRMPRDEVDRRRSRWNEALKRSLDWERS